MITILIALYCLFGALTMITLEIIRRQQPDTNTTIDIMLLILGSILWPLTLFIVLELYVSTKDIFKED